MKTDFDKISLSFPERLCLHKFYFHKTISTEQKNVKQLIANNLVSVIVASTDKDGYDTDSKFCRINENGKRYLIYRHNEIQKALFKSVIIPIIVAWITSLICA